MSATFKNSKKKLSQSELRKFMNEHKEKTQKNVKKIESPLAKYNEAGQLTCILCKSIVRSEAVWTIHINAKQHRQNVDQAKKLKEQTNNFTTALKRPLTPPLQTPAKKVKSILKNAPKTQIITSNITVISNETQDVQEVKPAEIPKDFFDKENKVAGEEMDVENPETLPEGFFDDPRLDAKARNIEFKDPIEEEWEKFQREIKDANHQSAAIIAEDQEEATNERQIDEIEEQMKNWSRVVNLERKKVEIIASINDEKDKMDEGVSSSGDEEDFDEYLDWRAKKAYK